MSEPTALKNVTINGVDINRVRAILAVYPATTVDGATDIEQIIAKRVLKRLRKCHEQGYPASLVKKQMAQWVVSEAMVVKAGVAT